MSKEEHSEEQSRDNPRSDFDFLDFSGKHFYYDVGYKTERYSVGNVVSEGIITIVINAGTDTETSDQSISFTQPIISTPT